ncbi:FAD-dependent urate hydroxylase [compost metagenome]
MEHQKIAVIGGGIGGLCASLALQRKGFQVTIYEKEGLIRPAGAGIGLGPNAVKALNSLGLKEQILKCSNSLDRFTIQSQNGIILSDIDFAKLAHKSGIGNAAIHRSDLHKVLRESLDEGTLQLNKKCVDFIQDENGVTLFFNDGESIRTDLVIVADGIHSIIRKKLLPHSTIRYAGYTCWRSVVPYDSGDQNHRASEIWGHDGRFGYIPLPSGHIYWFACVNSEANDPVRSAYTVSHLLELFDSFPHPVKDLIQSARNDQLIHNDIYDIQPLQQFAFGRIVLLGDAAHATTPNMGQGAGQAMEDAVVLGQCMELESNFNRAFKLYEQRRLRRTRKIIERSRQIGSVSQWSHPALIYLRNQLLKLVPDSLMSHSMQAQTQTDWE